MPNAHFRFRQFTVWQDRCAMKVCTDACVLGASAPLPAARILDVGTGTGLLALMLAQRSPAAQVDAVEIDPAAAQQATENARASPFATRLRVFASRIQDFAPPDALTYDLVVANPPFFDRHLPPPNPARALALHTTTLPLADLLAATQRLLAPGGRFCALLPTAQSHALAQLAVPLGLHLIDFLSVTPQAGGRVSRVVQTFGRAASPPTSRHLAVCDAPGRYSAAYRALMADFYLPR